MKQLGNIVANRDRLPMEEVFLHYEQTLYELFARRSRRNSNINVCEHMIGYFKHELSGDENVMSMSCLKNIVQKSYR